VALLEEEAVRIQAALRDTTAGRLQWASALVPQVLADAESRRRQREETGRAVLGVTTGLTQLDNLLGGLSEGLYLLAGPPGMGKTTLALQVAAAATQDIPVVVVTFEHAPANLTLKLLCGRVGVNLRDVQRGYADLAKLRHAAEAWAPVAQRLAVVEGSSQLTVAPVRAQARRAMRQHQAERCLVVVDYLQLWAKVAEDLRGNFSVRERVDMLGASCASSLWGCAARCWRWRRKTGAPAITARAKAAPRSIHSKKAATWSMPRMWCCF
jgi:replicative DNA helicase